MKKLLSILCTLALVLGVVLIPGVVSTSAAATDVNVTAFGSKITYNETEGYYELNAGDYIADVLTTDFEIAADKTYALSFDFSGDTAYFAPQAFVSGGNKLKFAFQKDNGASYTRFNNVSLVFNSNDMLKEGVTDKHLKIEISTVNNLPARIKNIKIEEVSFNSDYVYATYINKGMQAMGDGSGDVMYKNLALYSDQFIVLNKEIDATKTYTIEYYYKGKAGAEGFGWKWTTVNATDSSAGIPTASYTGVNHTYGNVLISDWTKCTITATGAELGANATKKYLTLAASSVVDSVICYFKNIKVSEATGSGSGEGGTSSGGTSSDSTSSGGTSSGGTSSGGSGEGTTPPEVVRDPEYIYPTTISGSATESSDDISVYKWDKNWVHGVKNTEVFRPTYGWSNNATAKGVLVFDETLEANAEYVLEIDRMGHYNAADYIKIGTAGANSSADFTNSKTFKGSYALEYGGNNYWHEGYTFKANDVINGTNTRLAIEISSGDAKCLVKNIKLTKVTRDSEYIYPVNQSVSIASVAEGDELVYAQSNPANGWLIFNQELKAGKTYLIEFDYYGHNVAVDYAWKFGAASATDIDVKANSDTFNGKAVSVRVPYVSNNHTGLKENKSYTHVARILSADDVITDTNKYLTIFSKGYDSIPFLKNFKVQEFSISEPYLAPSYIDGTVQIVPEENGDVGIGMPDSTIGDKGGITVFNKQLEAGKKYIIKMQVKGHNYQMYLGLGVTSGKDKNDIDSATPFYNSNNESMHATKIPLPVYAREWTSYGYVFNSDDIIKDDKTYLAFKQNVYYTGNGAMQPSMIKNLTIEEFVADEYLHPVKYDTTETQISIVGNDIAYATRGYTVGCLNYAVVIRPDKSYVISYDIYGGNYAGQGGDNFGWAATAIADPYTINFKGNDSSYIIPDIYAPLNSPDSNGKWTSHSITVSGADMGADDTNKYLALVKYGLEQTTYIKNLKVIERPDPDPGSVLINGTFENKDLGIEFWSDKSNIASHDISNGHDSSYSMHLTAGNFDAVAQNITLEKNTNYELTFWYKGTVGGQAMAAVSRDVFEISRRYMFAYTVSEEKTVADWTKATITFNTGNYEVFYIGFVAGSESDYYVDDVKLAPYSKAGEFNANELITEPYVNYEQPFNRYRHWTAAAGKNMIENGDFEGAIPASWGDFISGSNGVLSIVDGEGYDATAANKTGGKALMFKAEDLEKAAGGYIYISDLEPNTDYVLSYWTRAPHWTPTNDADMTHGIANVFDGSQYFTFRQEIRGNQVLTQDNQWHRTTIKFNTGANTRVAYNIMGANTTAYIDNLEVFAIEDAVDARPEVMLDAEQNRAYVTDTAPTKIYVADSKNLVKNGTFDDTNISFWNDADTTIGYKNGGGDELYYGKYVTLLDWNGIAEVKESGTSRGKALYYESKTDITGYPLGTAYVKYFDVEPNTEYTFIADYIITETYNNQGVLGYGAAYKAGDFGIAMVNSLNPIPIASINFYDNYNSNLSWQKMTVTFNTNGYEQVGIYVRDRGGAAFFDNISLFKTADGSETPVIEPDGGEGSGGTSSGGTGSEGTGSGGTSSGGTSSGGNTPVTPPAFIDGEIKSNEYTVTGIKGDKVMYGVAPGTTVKEVLDTLENSAGIKAFDAAGNEITDTSVPVGTNFSFRYMDGFSAVDAATVLIRGDINNDGYVDSKDMRLMMRSIVNANKESLTDEQMVVGDIDGDKEITPDDIAALSLHAGGSKLLEPIKYVSTEE